MSETQRLESRAERIQIDLLRRMGSAGRFQLMASFSRSVTMLARRAISRRCPALSEEQVNLEFIRLHYGEELEAGVRRELIKRGDVAGDRHSPHCSEPGHNDLPRHT